MANHKDPTEQALISLVLAWYKYRPLSVTITTHAFDPVEVPRPLLPTITSREPYRSEVLRDARLYLCIPYWAGIGMDIVTDEPLIEPFETWSQSVSPFKFRVEWSQHMDGRGRESKKEAWHRVVLEDGRWRIASLWSDHEREQYHLQIDQIKQFQKNK